MYKRILGLSLLTLSCSAHNTYANDPWVLVLGGKLHSGRWTGDNTRATFDSSENDFESDNTSGLGLSLGLSKAGWFAGMNLQTASYDFDEESPNFETDTGSEQTPNTILDASFFTLNIGYKFNSYIAVQGGIKSYNQDWEDSTQEFTYSGIGLGVSGYWPISDNWTAYATVGISNMNIEDNNNDNIGDATGASIELGGVYRIAKTASLSFGFRNEAIESEFDNGNEQQHNLGNLFIGFNYGINLSKN